MQQPERFLIIAYLSFFIPNPLYTPKCSLPFSAKNFINLLKLIAGKREQIEIKLKINTQVINFQKELRDVA
jgi:hypothetical protein